MNSNRLYSNRSLTETVNMVFDLVGEDWKKWTKMMVYFLLPFSVLMGAAIASFDIDTIDDLSPKIGTTLAVAFVLSIVGCAVVTAMQILLVQWRDTHDGTLEGCEVATMWRMLPRPMLKCLGVIVIGTPLVALALASVIIPVGGLVLLFAVLPVFMVCPIMLLEPKNSFLSHIKRAFSLGYSKWGRLILMALIMGLVTFFINNAVAFPRAIYTMADSVFEFSTTDNVIWSFVMDVCDYVLSVAQCFMYFVQMGLFVLAMTYHYGSVVAEAEDIGLESDIDNFAQL